MKHNILVSIFLLAGIFCTTAQNTPEKLANIIHILDSLEENSSISFYYNPTWLDSVTVKLPSDNEGMEDYLTKVFENTAFNFYREGANIYVTKDVKIVSELPILDILEVKNKKSEAVDFEKGLLFTREYANQGAEQENLEDQVFELGRRKEMVPGGGSTVAGYVREAESGDPLIGAAVYVEDPVVATTTDGSGFYSLKLKNGKNTLHYQYAGRKETRRNIVLFSNGQLDVDMEVDVIALQEVTVVSNRDENIENVQMGVSRIDVAASKNVPIVLGERDVLKVATTLAGVQTLGEGASGFNVRGGKSDQNLLLLDGATLYNASHFLGFFSVFNSDVIESMEIFKSSIPSKYGGRLSSIFEIESKPSNREKFSGYGGISPITSKLTTEIPLLNQKAGLTLSGRTTYSNWVLNNVGNSEFKNNKISFYDLLMRFDLDLNKQNKITASSYLSKDKFRITSDSLFSFSDFAYTNTSGSIKWKRMFNDRLIGTFTGSISSYEYELEYDESEPNAFYQDFGINEAGFKGQLNYLVNDQNEIEGGIELKNYNLNPGTKTPMGEGSLVAPITIHEEQGVERALYISNEYAPNDQLTISGGLRYSVFSTLGPKTVYTYDEGAPKSGDTRADSTVYGKGETIQTYQGLEPRIAARYKLDGASSVKLAYNRTRQYIHTLSNSASLSPTDIWRLSSTHLLPQIGDQYAIGYYKNIKGNLIEASIEGYYKRLQNLIDFKVGADFLLNQNVETVALQGPGKSYGVELSLKKSGRLNGWINYAYARTFIKLDGDLPEEVINEGKFYPANYDIPHTLNLVANYKITQRVSFSYNFTFNTGRPITYPVGAYDYNGLELVYYSDRNAYRIPNYMRMDIGFNLEAGHKLGKLTYSYWSLSIYNLLGRNNPYSIFFDVQNGQVEGYQLVVFGDPIPTITYNFRF